MRVVVSAEMLRRTRYCLKEVFPGLKASHISEAVAAALGFRTANAITSWLLTPEAMKTRVMDVAAFVRRMDELGEPGRLVVDREFRNTTDVEHIVSKDIWLEEDPAVIARAFEARFQSQASPPMSPFFSPEEEDDSYPPPPSTLGEDEAALYHIHQRALQRERYAERAAIRQMEQQARERREDEPRWATRLGQLLHAVLPVMAYLRDTGHADFDAATLRACLSMDWLVTASLDRGPVPLPGDLRQRIDTYLTGLPGYEESAQTGLRRRTLDQHGYLQMNIWRMTQDPTADVASPVFALDDDRAFLFDTHEGRAVELYMMSPLRSHDGAEAAKQRVINQARSVEMGTRGGCQVIGAGRLDDLPMECSFPLAFIYPPGTRPWG